MSQGVPEQLRLDLQGGVANRQRKEYPGARNFYFALLPEPAAADMALRQARKAGLPGRLQSADVLHVSLFGLGKYAHLPPYRLANAQAAANAVFLPCFDLAFDRILNFGRGPHPHLVLAAKNGSTEIAHLCRQLAAGPGAVPDADIILPRINPHMTLVYDGRRIKEVLLAEPVRWTVREFVLVQSLYGQSRHEYLGRWQLRPAGDAPL